MMKIPIQNIWNEGPTAGGERESPNGRWSSTEKPERIRRREGEERDTVSQCLRDKKRYGLLLKAGRVSRK